MLTMSEYFSCKLLVNMVFDSTQWLTAILGLQFEHKMKLFMNSSMKCHLCWANGIFDSLCSAFSCVSTYCTFCGYKS